MVKTFIVEDSAVILESLVATLEEMAPVEVVGSAPDEAGAVAWLADRNNPCDLIIIDIFLKHGSGLGVLQASRRLQLPGKRIVLTNYATPAMRKTCEDFGADRVFDKSADIEALVGYCEGLSAQPGGSNTGNRQ